MGRGFVDVPGRCPVFARETVCNLPSPKYRFCATQLAKLEAALGRPLVRLQSNESARPPHPKIAAAAAAAAAGANRYPCAASSDLRAALAARLGVAPGRLLVTCGSEQAIRLIGEGFLDDVTVAISPSPTFPVYTTALGAAGCSVVDVDLCHSGSSGMSGGDGGDAGGPSGEIGASDGEGDRGEKGRQAGRQCGPWGEDIGAAHCGELSVAAQACSLNGASRVVVLLSTVNNPTGGRVGAQALSALRESLPKEVLLVVDDAYAEFGEVERPGDDALAVLRAGDEAVAAGGEGAHHWILLRTFAKAYGLAGLRVGYALGSSEEVAGVLHKVKGVFQVNAPAQAAALAALELGDAHLYEGVRRTLSSRSRLEAGLRRLGLPSLPTAGNFVCFDVSPAPAAEVARRLAEERGVLTCALGPLGPRGALAGEAIRASAGGEGEIDALLEGLAAVLGSMASERAAADQDEAPAETAEAGLDPAARAHAGRPQL